MTIPVNVSSKVWTWHVTVVATSKRHSWQHGFYTRPQHWHTNP